MIVSPVLVPICTGIVKSSLPGRGPEARRAAQRHRLWVPASGKGMLPDVRDVDRHLCAEAQELQLLPMSSAAKTRISARLRRVNLARADHKVPVVVWGDEIFA